MFRCLRLGQIASAQELYVFIDPGLLVQSWAHKRPYRSIRGYYKSSVCVVGLYFSCFYHTFKAESREAGAGSFDVTVQL